MYCLWTACLITSGKSLASNAKMNTGEESLLSPGTEVEG